MKNIHLVIIDPQNDFMDSRGSALPVLGANADMGRIAAFIAAHGKEIKQIHVTLDSHQEIDIAHPAWWLDEKKQMIIPHISITSADIKAGKYTTRNSADYDRSLSYTQQLEARGKEHYIWPSHCLIGTHGHNVQEYLMNFLYKWELEHNTRLNFVVKGTNPYTEHYGALIAEIPNEDPATQINERFLEHLRQADTILVCGEALSHCVSTTVDQMVANIGKDHVSKIKILTDAASPVAIPVFEEKARNWLVEIEEKGVGMTTTTTFFT